MNLREYSKVGERERDTVLVGFFCLRRKQSEDDGTTSPLTFFILRRWCFETGSDYILFFYKTVNLIYSLSL